MTPHLSIRTPCAVLTFGVIFAPSAPARQRSVTSVAGVTDPGPH